MDAASLPSEVGGVRGDLFIKHFSSRLLPNFNSRFVDADFNVSLRVLLTALLD